MLQVYYNIHVYYHTHTVYVINVHVPFTTTSVITQDGETALMKAAWCGHTEVVIELVKAKANLDLQNNVS